MLMPASEASPDSRILVFSKTTGYRHESIEPGKSAIIQLGLDNGFKVDTTEDATMFNPEVLGQYDAVVFLNTTQDVLDTSQQEALMSYIRSGHGFVGIHSAADTEYDWPWYGRLVGAYFDGHPNDPNVRDGVLIVADSSHQSTKHLPHRWTRTDEWYDYRSHNPDVTVLLTAVESSYKRPEENPSAEAHPIAWYHDFDGGRAFYTGLGHTSESYSEPMYLQHILGGILYAIGQPIGRSEVQRGTSVSE